MIPRLVRLCRKITLPVFLLLSMAVTNSIGAQQFVDQTSQIVGQTSAGASVTNTGELEAKSSEPQQASVNVAQPPHEPEPTGSSVMQDQSNAFDTTNLSDSTSPTIIVTAREPDDIAARSSPATSLDCIADECVDQYLWSLYQSTRKQGVVRIIERKKVVIKKRGRRFTVARSYTKVIDEDFSWKDLKAAGLVGMRVIDYVIGGVDRNFKQRLFRMLRAAEIANLSPGITSAFRDDYRQSIASGFKAAGNRSYHGGSLRGGYGHGFAADLVSTAGATQSQRLTASRLLWDWIDANGNKFGIGRPYLDKDPPHVAPIDGKEYADHRPEAKVREGISVFKLGEMVVLRDARSSP